MSEFKTVKIVIRKGYTAEEFIQKLPAYGATDIKKWSDNDVSFKIHFLKASNFLNFDEVDSLSFAGEVKVQQAPVVEQVLPEVVTAPEVTDGYQSTDEPELVEPVEAVPDPNS